MDDLKRYARENAVQADIDNARLKKIYLDTMETSIAAYNLGDIENRIDTPSYDFQDIFPGHSRIGMSRLVNVLSFLIRYGRSSLRAFRDILVDALIDDILKPHPKSGVEFLILEMCTALIAEGGKPEIVEKLGAVDPYEKYDSTLERRSSSELHNFCMYGICSEYLRGSITGIDTSHFIERHWEVQRDRFNDNGRYMDPGCPMVYDLTSRYRLALMLSLGYDGPPANEMRAILEKGAFGLLFQMSSDHKFPYGGRSNQFNFNETLSASMFEYYAGVFDARGDSIAAGLFRNAALKSIRGIQRWLTETPARHIKNMYPVQSAYGIDSYGTYERYMGTMGAFTAGAVLFNNKDIPGFAIPVERSGYVMAVKDEFHKVFASAAGYSVEIDTAGDTHYDATGLGRIHYVNAPVEIALSMPFAGEPKYLLGDETNTSSRAIGVYKNGPAREYLAETSGDFDVMIHEESQGRAVFTVRYGDVAEEYTMSRAGVSIACKAPYPISYCVPVFVTNGGEESSIDTTRGCCIVSFRGWMCRISWDPSLEHEYSGEVLRNRNGVYRELNIINHSPTIRIGYSITPAAGKDAPLPV